MTRSVTLPLDIKMSILEQLKIADVVTLVNGLLGLFAIFFAVEGNYLLAALLIFLAAVLDFFDGRIARMCNNANDFGKNLDSLADIVSFGVAPAVIGYCAGLRGYLGFITLSIYLAGGFLRLARFNTKANATKKMIYFKGLPIPAAGLIIAGIFVLGGTGITIYHALVYSVLGLLMVSSFKVKKL